MQYDPTLLIHTFSQEKNIKIGKYITYNLFIISDLPYYLGISQNTPKALWDPQDHKESDTTE